MDQAVYDIHTEGIIARERANDVRTWFEPHASPPPVTTHRPPKNDFLSRHNRPSPRTSQNRTRPRGGMAAERQARKCSRSGTRSRALGRRSGRKLLTLYKTSRKIRITRRCVSASASERHDGQRFGLSCAKAGAARSTRARAKSSARRATYLNPWSL